MAAHVAAQQQLAHSVPGACIQHVLSAAYPPWNKLYMMRSDYAYFDLVHVERTRRPGRAHPHTHARASAC